MAPMMMLVLVIPETERQRGEREAECVLIGWGSVVSRVTADTGGYINHKSLQQNTKHTTFSGKSVKGDQGRGNLTAVIPLAGLWKELSDVAGYHKKNTFKTFLNNLNNGRK